MQSLQHLISTIKQKKELRQLDDSFIEQELHKILNKEPKLSQLLQQNFSPKSQAYKTIVKKARAELRQVYGVFRADSKRGKFPLETHTSTRERLSFYSQLYQRIFAITGNPKIILDLGCGLNPLSLPFMNFKKMSYYAYDLSTAEIGYLNTFFQEFHATNPSFQGRAAVLNLLDTSKITTLPQADVAFLFKVTDTLDRNQGHRKTEEILASIPARYLVVSFSTRTMSGKPMTAPRRRWMEWLCQRRGWKYTVLEFPGEIFYVIKK